MTLLFLPKLLAALLLIVQHKVVRPYGGRLRLFISLIIEMLFSALLAPIRMLFHTQYVVSALLGISVVWKSPPRDDTAKPWSPAAIRHGGGTLLGLAWLGLVYWLNQIGRASGRERVCKYVELLVVAVTSKKQ